MIRTCKVKLGRAHKQEARLFTILSLCHQLYNAALQQRIEAYGRQGISLSFFDQCKELVQLRAEDEDYKSLPSEMTRLTALKRLDLAFKGFFRRIKTGEKPGFPRFKGHDRFDTLVFGTVGWKIDGKKLIVRAGTGGPIILHMRNAIYKQGEITGLHFVRRANRWWAHFLVDIGEAPTVKPSENGVGIDVGIRTFGALSDGSDPIKHPKFLNKSLSQLREAQQVLSRKKKGSKNRAKAKFVLTRMHEKIKNRRSNFVFQTVATLTSKYDGFAVEKLDIKAMTDKENPSKEMSKKGARGLRRGIMDSAWLMFVTQLDNKAEEAGYPVVHVDPRGTSQLCSNCGSLVRKTLRDREHECHACGLVMDRDLNAAKNILQRAKNNSGCELVTGSTGPSGVEGTEVRL